MGKTYRFVWDHSSRGLVAPEEFNELPDSRPEKSIFGRIAKQISKDSGAAQLPGFIMVVFHYCILVVMLVVYCVVEAKYRAISNGVILLLAPFISFLPIVYAMIRESPINKINHYMDHFEQEFTEEIGKHKAALSYLFISDAKINGKEYSFFQRVIMGRNFSGFVEFEENFDSKPSELKKESKTKEILKGGHQEPDSSSKESLQKNVVAPKQIQMPKMEEDGPLLQGKEITLTKQKISDSPNKESDTETKKHLVENEIASLY